MATAAAPLIDACGLVTANRKPRVSQPEFRWLSVPYRLERKGSLPVSAPRPVGVLSGSPDPGSSCAEVGVTEAMR